MTAVQIVLGIIQLIICVALIVVFAVQQAPDKSGISALSGESAGFFGQSKSKSRDKMLKNITVILGVVFAVLTVVLALFIS